MQLSYLGKFAIVVRFSPIDDEIVDELFGGLNFWRVDYTQLHTLFCGKLFLRNYVLFAGYRDLRRTLFFRQAKFAFVFEFIKFFLKRIFKFFANFVVFNKYSFWLHKGFECFIINFSNLILQKDACLVLTGGQKIFACGLWGRICFGLRSVSSFTNRIKCVPVLNVIEPDLFFLTNLVEKFFTSPVPGDFTLFSVFNSAGVLTIWSRLRKFRSRLSRLRPRKKLLFLSRGGVYSKPRVISKLTKFTRIKVRRRSSRYILNNFTLKRIRKLTRFLKKRLPDTSEVASSLFKRMRRLRNLSHRTRLKLLFPLISWGVRDFAKEAEVLGMRKIVRSYKMRRLKSFRRRRRMRIFKKLGYLSRRANLSAVRSAC